MTSDYKKYSLDKLQEWVHDAMNSDASPHEIYSAIREAVREEYYYHKDRISRATGLLELMSGHRPVADKELFEAAVAEREYYEGANKSLSCDKDDPSPECQDAWNDFWEEYYYPEEHNKSVNLDKEVEEIRKEGGYEWTPEPAKKRWILPVEQVHDDYFVSFPDDLLEAANLKEGDEIYWVDNGDGTWMIRKVTKPLGMDEC